MKGVEAPVRRLLRSLQRWVPQRPGGVTILAYHLVGGDTDSPVDLPVETFRRHLEELQSVPVLSLDAALARLEDPDASGQTAVVLTFDDAYGNFTDRAWPLLEEADLPATLYVPVGFLDGSVPPPLTGAEHLSPMPWPALAELARDRRITVGSHSMTHRNLDELQPGEVRDELVRSRERLEDRLGVEVRHFCYPRGQLDRTSARLAGQAYATAVMGGGRRVRPDCDPARLPRFPIRRDGPDRLSTLWTHEVWLEEWVAHHGRRYLP